MLALRLHPAHIAIRRVAVTAVSLLIAAASVSAALPGAALASRHSHPPAWYTGTQWMQSPLTFRAHNFTLLDQARRPVSLAQFRGKVVLLTFTSSVCTKQCPLVARAAATIERLSGRLARHTALVNISVQPEADTRHTVQRFAHEMGWQPYTWYYLWSSRHVMEPIWKAYGVAVQAPPRNDPDADISHLAVLALIDGRGYVRGYFAYPFNPVKIAAGVRDLAAGRK